jgi:hypothetical protein
MAAVAAAGFALSGPSHAQTIRVEAESFVPPNAVATMGSGPNESKVVTVDQNASASGGFTIGWFGSWDWLEYNVTAPADGIYNMSFFYGDGDGAMDPLPVDLTFFTTGKQYLVGNIHPTPVSSPSWAFSNYTTVVAAPSDGAAPFAIPLKSGVNRFRVAIRPDFILAGAMNIDYMEFTKTADAYPALQAITGVVSSQIGGVSTPLGGAMVSDGPDYHTAANVTRTDGSGAFTLWVPAGSYSLTAFANGFTASTVSASSPSATNFSLTWNGRYEAELLDSTNTGPEVGNGDQPAYDTQHSLSNKGEIVNSAPGKYAEYKSVYAPADGVYDVSIHYSAMSAAVGDPGYLLWTVNQTSTVKAVYTATSITDFLTYQDSTAPALMTLKKGLNTLRFADANAGPPVTPSANIDYFTVAPSTQPHGTLKVIVTNSVNGNPISGANITIPAAAPQLTAQTGGDGSVSIPVPPGTYTVTASKSGTAGPVTAAPATVADGQTVNVPIQLTVSGVSVEAEDFVAGGPGVPPATITAVGSASNGKVVTGFTGSYLQGWLEWNVNVTEDGLYRMTLQYAVPPDGSDAIVHPVYPIDMTVSATPSTFHVNTSYYLDTSQIPPAKVPIIPRTADGDTYASFDLVNDSQAQALVPLKAGSNRVRISLASGTMNLDYLQFTKLAAYPTNYRTITGTIYGSDGVGSAPIAGAAVWQNNSTLHTTFNEAQFATTTDAAGHYSLTAVSGAFLNASVNGFIATTPYISVPAGTATKDVTLNVNPPTPPDTGTEKMDAFKLSIADTRLSTNENMITFTQPGAYFGWTINVPRSGQYQVGMNYSSGWNSGDGLPVKTTWTVNGVPQEVDFAKTTSWTDFQFFPSIATIPLNAGGNTVRVDFIDAGANIVYLTLLRTGSIPPPVSTDIDNSGKTDIIDAVIYARRLGGLEAGAKPDLTGDGLSNAADVARILRVAGGLN